MKKFSIEYLKFEMRHSEVGFTLVELIVAIAIIATLAAMVIATLNPFAQFQKANDGRRKSDLAQISRALETYYQDNGRYPSADASHHIKRLDGTSVTWGQSWSPYMSVVPKDPLDPSRSYVYVVSSTGQTYYLYASLERGSSDPQACTGTNNKCSNVPAGVACGGSNICNYGVTSPNVNP